MPDEARPLRVLVITDQWPTSSDPSPAPSVWRPMLEIPDRVAWRALWMRRVFPPLRLVRPGVRWNERVEDARVWAHEQRQVPSSLAPVAGLRYTSPPRSRWEHTWGVWATTLRRQTLSRELQAFAPDLIHGHWAAPCGDVAVRLAHHLGVPSVVSVHGYDLAVTARASARARRAVERILCGADLVVANSGATAQEIQGLTRGRASVRTLWQGGDLCAGAADIHSPVRIVTIGHLYAHKGVGEAANVLAECKAMGMEFRWTIIGSGSSTENARLRAKLDSSGLSPVTTHLTRMPNSEVLRVLAGSDLLLHLPDREAYGIVIAEALGAGVAVVGSLAAGAVSDFVANAAPVTAVSPGDQAQAVATVSGLLRDRERLRGMKHASAAWARERLGWVRYAGALADEYEALVSTGTRRGVR